MEASNPVGTTDTLTAAESVPAGTVNLNQHAFVGAAAVQVDVVCPVVVTRHWLVDAIGVYPTPFNK
jgi:hypothetical protein